VTAIAKLNGPDVANRWIFGSRCKYWLITPVKNAKSTTTPKATSEASVYMSARTLGVIGSLLMFSWLIPQTYCRALI
jgi:hypothetical protein